jgi:ABC-type branched-subunit amino acid transport system substrate-binding protein
MRPAALLAFDSDIHSLGLEIAQGLYLTAAWYWDLNDKTRAFSKRFFEKTGVEPTMNQAAYYSATLTYLNAVKAAGTTDADKVMDELQRPRSTICSPTTGRSGPTRTDGTFHVCHAGQDAVGIEISLGLLSRRPENIG